MAKKILIIDDEKDIQDVFKKFFTSHGFTEITCASDGLEAFVHCSQTKFDLITLDYQMPYLNGATFLTALRNKEGLNQLCPVFMISAFIPDIDDAIKAFENTFFFDKPVNFESMERTAKFLLAKKEQTASL